MRSYRARRDLRGTLSAGLLLSAAGLSGCGPQRVLFNDRQSGPPLAFLAPIQGRPYLPEEETLLLPYRERMMELKVTRCGLVNLREADAELRPDDPGIVTEKLCATFDMTATQWQGVFREWFCHANGLPAAVTLRPMAITIAGHAAWEYTCAAHGKGSDGSRYWRVYLFPRGRTAFVLRSIGWRAGDRSRFDSGLDRLAANLDPDI